MCASASSSMHYDSMFSGTLIKAASFLHVARVPPPPLTLDRLKAGVYAFKKHPEKQSLLEAMIRESFGNWDVLNFSFPNGKDVSSDDPGVSLSEVHAAYKIILALPSPFIRAMMNGVEQILRRPGRPLKQRGDIRFLLIIMENPLLLQQSFPQESSYHHHIVKSIVGSIANLPNRVHYTLVLWLSQHSQSSLKRKVTLVSQFVSYRLEKYDRARRRNQTQRMTPLTSYSSQSNQTELPAFQRTRSITHAPPMSTRRRPYAERIGRHNRMRSNTDSRISLSSHEKTALAESRDASSSAEGNSGPGTPEIAANHAEGGHAGNSPFASGASAAQGTNHALPGSRTRPAASSRPGNRASPLATSVPIPPRMSGYMNGRSGSADTAHQGFQSDAETADAANNISTFAGAAMEGGASDHSKPLSPTGLGIENLVIGEANPAFPSLGSTPPSALPRRMVDNGNQLQQAPPRIPAAPSPMYIRVPELARVEDDWADKATRKRRSKTVGGWANEGGRSMPGSLTSGSSNVLPEPWRTNDTDSPSASDLTPPPQAHARENSSGIAEMTTPDPVLRQSQFVPLRSHKNGSPAKPESPVTASANTLPRRSDAAGKDASLTSFIPIRSTPEIPQGQALASHAAPAVESLRGSSRPAADLGVLPVNPFRSLRGPPRPRASSMTLSDFAAEASQESNSVPPPARKDAQLVDQELAVRPARDSVLGVLDGTAEPSNPATNLGPRSSLTRTRSSSEAPIRRRADHEILTANEPPSSNLVGDWGSGVDLDDYYVGADGVFYPKSSSLVMYQHDWRLVTAAKVMALLHAANLLLPTRSRLPIEAFYNEAIDNMDLISDYDAWQARVPGAFSFCQYPFLLSLKAKVQIMQVDAARQMDSKLKEAVISALFQNYHSRVSNPSHQPHLKLLIRRRCLVEDSLHQLATREQDLKKRLKIEFVGEEGVDAGGLAKEWFMLLVRELMNPMYGMFRRESDDSAGSAPNANGESGDGAWGGAYWFNPASLETSNQYFLVGVVAGLALYNSTILDLHLPLAVFKKLLRTNFYPTPSGSSVSPSFGSQATDNPPPSIVSGNHSLQHPSATGGSGGNAGKGKGGNGGGVNGQKGAAYAPRYGPAAAASGKLGGGSGGGGGGASGAAAEGRSPIYGLLSPSAQIRYQINEMMSDVSEFRPQLARGLRQLLQYRGDDVEDVFCLSFEASYDAYGEVVTVPLVSNGANIPVTSSNRVEYVTRYLQWILNDSIAKQFEPFRRGFYYVCGGNALSLFKPEEIELMVHGSDADWDPNQLEAITEYVNFGGEEEQHNKMLIAWFWEILHGMTPVDRRAFLAFVTGTDRMPTVANTQLKLKLVLLGDDYRRLPIAHTCFNQLGIWRYRSKLELHRKLSMALKESEGFGLR
ncbi:HECT-domain-containing protein [Martensiomyces pterosporus]|nr:HECT-domain-containing protein [Martensiomyces pterosporus]